MSFLTAQRRARTAGTVVVALLCATALSGFGSVGVARADHTNALSASLTGAARGPLALAATRVLARLEDESHSGPRLTAPPFARELERSWSVAPGAALRFDSVASVFALAWVLDVVPMLPRLDGLARVSLSPEATAMVLLSAARCAPVEGAETRAFSCDRFVDAATLAAAGRGERSSAPGAELRGASSRLLRSFGLGSIAGQPVVVLDEAEDAATAAREDLDALAWLNLPPRPWHGPEADDDMALSAALRAQRGRGAMGVTTRLTMRSAALRLIGTF